MQLTQSQAAAVIYQWLGRNHYDLDFKNDVAMLLAENRRTGRSSNVIKYGVIPYTKDPLSGKVRYDDLDIKKLIDERLKPICEELQRKRLERATKARKGAYTPYAS